MFKGPVITYNVFILQICLCTFPIPIELVQHFKTHGLMLYQCAWCVFGAENEAELLTHASAKHPSQIPQAYLRVITQKVSTLSNSMNTNPSKFFLFITLCFLLSGWKLIKNDGTAFSSVKQIICKR